VDGFLLPEIKIEIKAEVAGPAHSVIIHGSACGSIIMASPQVPQILKSRGEVMIGNAFGGSKTLEQDLLSKVLARMLEH